MNDRMQRYRDALARLGGVPGAYAAESQAIERTCADQIARLEDETEAARAVQAAAEARLAQALSDARDFLSVVDRAGEIPQRVRPLGATELARTRAGWRELDAAVGHLRSAVLEEQARARARAEQAVPQHEDPPASAETESSPARKERRGCRDGCLGRSAAAILVLGVAAGWTVKTLVA